MTLLTKFDCSAASPPKKYIFSLWEINLLEYAFCTLKGFLKCVWTLKKSTISLNTLLLLSTTRLFILFFLNGYAVLDFVALGIQGRTYLSMRVCRRPSGTAESAVIAPLCALERFLAWFFFPSCIPVYTPECLSFLSLTDGSKFTAIRSFEEKKKKLQSDALCSTLTVALQCEWWGIN